MSIIIINAITVPKERAAELEKRFASRAGEVDEQSGFLGFKLLRPMDGRDVYHVMTEWASPEDFQKWMSSPAFQHGHKATNEQGPVGTGSEVLQFEVVDFDAS